MKPYVLIVALSLIVSGCSKKAEGVEIMAKERVETNARCVGRYIVQLPTTFTQSTVTTGVFKPLGLGPQDPSIEISVRAEQLTLNQFGAEVRRRGEELKSKGDETVDVLRLERKLSDDATLFRVQQIKDAYVSEVNLLRRSGIVTIRLESYHGKFAAAEETLIDFAARVREADADITKLGQKFCLGPVVVSGDFAEESGGFLFRDGKGENFDITVDNHAHSGDGGLMSRMSGPDSLLTKFKVEHTVLRARERSVLGMRSQEWLGWANLGEQQVEKTFKFALDTMPSTPGKSTPNINLTFDSAQPLDDGTETKNWMTDEQAIELWDSVVASIRPTIG
jgi:hypothetical protein